MSPIPRWLEIATTDYNHLSHVLEVLSHRESKRERARSATRPERRSRIRAALSSVPREHVEHYGVAVGSRAEHTPHNRYYGVEPFDRTRVVVAVPSAPGDGDDGGGRYLNAN